MAETKYRDAYILVDLFDSEVFPYSNSAVTIECDEVYAEDTYIGLIDNYVEDVLEVSPLLEQLRKDNVIPVNVEKAAFLNANDTYTLDVESGVAVATQGNLTIVYCGVVELPDNYGTVNAGEYYNELIEESWSEEIEEECYTLTEKGLKYLAELEEKAQLENCVDCAESRFDKMCNVCPEEREESKVMDNLFGNLGFGKLKGNRFKISMNGIAVAQESTGKYVVYNKENNEFVDVTNTLIDIKDALFVLPAVDINAGDTVIHENKPYFIVDATNEIKAVSYDDCTQTVLIPKSTMFGIKYFTKVFSMFGDNFASAGDLFSNPMMLMALMEGKNSDLTQLMLLNSLNSGDLGSNPMALAMMLKGDNSSDSLSTIAMMSMLNNGTNPFAPKKKDAKKTTANN